MERKSYASLDVVKFICAMIILLYHWGSEWGNGIPSLVQELFSLYAIVLPIFLVISGFLFFTKLNSVSEKEQKGVLLHQVKRIFKVYLLWSIGYIVFQIYTWIADKEPARVILKDIWNWFTYSTFYTIWFLPALAVGLLIVYVLYKKLGLKKTFVICLCLYVVGALGSTYSSLSDKIPVLKLGYEYYRMYLNDTRNGLFYTPIFLVVGGFIAQRQEEISWKKSLVGTMIAGVALLSEALVMRRLVGGAGIDFALFQIAFSWFCVEFVLALKLDFVSKRVSLWMRQMSMLIFVSQRYFSIVIPEFFSGDILLHVQNSNIASFAITCGGTMVFSAILLALSKQKIKGLQHLY